MSVLVLYRAEKMLTMGNKLKSIRCKKKLLRDGFTTTEMKFNNKEIDHSYWGIYGDEYTFNKRYGQKQGMLQTYRKEQISFIDDQGKKVVRITATRDDNPPATTYEPEKHRPGWWSGVLSSRDAKNYNSNPSKFYPLFSRIEIKAKVPYEYGVWMALWLRHYKGC